ncbi:MAG: hypothetical protein H6834_16525 [Planctomycetes bacterium]|nr:hypothetical protein [Planctomycetota bacterium]
MMNAVWTIGLLGFAFLPQDPASPQDPAAKADRSTRMREVSARVRVAEKELLFSPNAELRAKEFIGEEMETMRNRIRNDEERLAIVEEDLKAMSGEYKALKAGGEAETAMSFKETRKTQILRQIREARDLKRSIASQKAAIDRMQLAREKLDKVVDYKNQERRRYDEKTFRFDGGEFGGIDSSMIPDVDGLSGADEFSPEELAQFNALFGDGPKVDPFRELVRSIRFRR